MKKFFSSLFLVLLIIGIAGAATTFKAAKVAFSGETINLNEAVKSDFSEPAKIEGEIYYVYDIIAIEEVTRTTYGIETGSEETNFYLIESYSKEQYEKSIDDEEATADSLTLIYSTGNEDTIAKLDKMVEDWYAYEEEIYSISSSAVTEEDYMKIYDVPLPEDTLEISGMITEYEDMDELNDYRDEYLGYIYESDELKEYIDTYCVDMIIDNTNVDTSKTFFIVAIAIAIVGLVGLIFTALSGKKKKAATEEFY